MSEHQQSSHERKNQLLTRFLLSEHLRQSDLLVDAFLPRERVKGESHNLSVFGDRRKLEEVAANDQLNATKGRIVSSNFTSEILEGIE